MSGHVTYLSLAHLLQLDFHIKFGLSNQSTGYAILLGQQECLTFQDMLHLHGDNFLAKLEHTLVIQIWHPNCGDKHPGKKILLGI